MNPANERGPDAANIQAPRSKQSANTILPQNAQIDNARGCSFVTWLRQQKRRDDRVGDIARDFIQDCRTERRRFNRRDLSRRVRDAGYQPAVESLTVALHAFRACRGLS